MITRRLALFRIGASTAAATAVAASSLIEAKAELQADSRESFKSPPEYLAAMQAIGWQPLAMFSRRERGGVQCMGVIETAPKGEAATLATWSKYHAIQMRCPVQLPYDVHPTQHWWDVVWQHLYEHGLRQDVTLAHREA